MKIFQALVSLPGSPRTAAFFAENQLAPTGFAVFGVDGRALPAQRYHQAGVAGRRRPMSPAEVGCALSHVAACQAFLASDADLLLVFEDDARLLRPLPDFSSVLAAAPRVPTLLHLGGQDGLATRARLRGTRLQTEPELWQVPHLALRHLWRSCAYLLNRAGAERMLDCQERRLLNADTWRCFFAQAPATVLYSPQVWHPADARDSLIEADRRGEPPRPWPARLRSKVRGALAVGALVLARQARIHPNAHPATTASRSAT